jgi:hypothetical protein
LRTRLQHAKPQAAILLLLEIESMKRKYFVAGLGLALVAVAAGIAWQQTAGQQGPSAANAKNAADTHVLPIAQVILFNSGVGYLQREGEVSGDTKVEMTFPTSDINDLLKSLVLQDAGGGKIGVISYDSQDPVDKLLRSFALDLNNNPSFGQILNQARGEKIELQRQERPGANPFRVAGTIIGMEEHKQPTKDGAVEVEQVNLLTAEGMVSVPLAQVLSVRFLNPTLDNEFKRALEVLARAHDVQKKTVTLHFNGNGKRPVRVGYVVERPIWKTTYRLVLEPNGKLFLQGWAIVENTSDDDWNGVRMVLVSGKPISFRMDLYEPLYIPRPLVEPDLFASLRPPVYGGSMEGGPVGGENKEPAKIDPKTGMPGFPGGYGGYGPVPGGQPNQFPGNQGPQPNQPGNKYQQDLKNYFQALGGNANLPNKLAYDEMVARKEKLKEGKQKGSAIAGLNYREGIQSVATSEEVGDYYQYIIDQKISLARQKSAMLPIVNQVVDGHKVSIFNANVHHKYPLLGLRLKNTSGKPLTQGPITVYDDGAYAGDTRTLDLQPNEQRLLSYAIDQGTEVKTEVKSHPGSDMTFNLGGDNLTAGYTLRETTTYTVKNRSTHDHLLIIEHPIRDSWKLVDEKAPKERSRDVYRFEVNVPAGTATKYEVVEDQRRVDPVALTKPGQDEAPYYQVIDGIRVKPLVRSHPQQLLSLKIVKGVLETEQKQKESKTYFIQNNSSHDHAFTVDHLIPSGWKRLDSQGKDQAGPGVYRFKLEVKSGKTNHEEVTEERVFQDKTRVLKTVDDDVLRQLLAHPAPAAKVKEALHQVLDKRDKLATVKQELATLKQEHKLLVDDQARVREALLVIPQSSEHYKDFVTKFVAMEKNIENLQKAIRTSEAQLLKLQQEYDTFVTGLTVQ